MKRLADVAALLPLPYLLFLIALGLGAVELTPAGFRMPHPARPAPLAGSVVAAILLSALALLPHAASSGLRVAGNVVESIVVFLGAGFGGVSATLNWLGGIEGRDPGPPLATAVLGVGVGLCVLALLAIAARLAWEIRAVPPPPGP